MTIEDAAELRLRQPHVVRLEARPPNVEGRGEVTIRQLVRNALRMRPDRIVVGEVRGAEALDMLHGAEHGPRRLALDRARQLARGGAPADRGAGADGRRRSAARGRARAGRRCVRPRRPSGAAATAASGASRRSPRSSGSPAARARASCSSFAASAPCGAARRARERPRRCSPSPPARPAPWRAARAGRALARSHGRARGARGADRCRQRRGALLRLGREGREPGAVERRQLLVCGAAAAFCIGALLSGPGRRSRRSRSPRRWLVSRAAARAPARVPPCGRARRAGDRAGGRRRAGGGAFAARGARWMRRRRSEEPAAPRCGGWRPS